MLHFAKHIKCNIYNIFKLSLILYALLLNSYSSANTNENKIQWGVGFLSIHGNHYRGSDQAKSWFFPIPYFSYKSDSFEADPSYIRGIFYQNRYVSLKFNLMLGLRVENDENIARRGMPNIDYTLEAGPMVIFYLWESKTTPLKLNLEIPIRSVYATNLKYLHSIGYFTVPYLNIIYGLEKTKWDWHAELSLSPMYASQKYHQYFYGIEKEYEIPGRNFYLAHGGYSGFQAALVVNKKWGSIVLIPFIRWDYLRSTVFFNSPLIKKTSYTITGLGLFYLF